MILRITAPGSKCHESMFFERGEDDYITFDYMLNIKKTRVHQKSQYGSNEELEAGFVIPDLCAL